MTKHAFNGVVGQRFPADLIKVARRKLRFALRLSKAFGTSHGIFQPTVPQIATFSGHSLEDVEAILEAQDLGTAKRGARGLEPGPDG